MDDANDDDNTEDNELFWDSVSESCGASLNYSFLKELGNCVMRDAEDIPFRRITFITRKREMQMIFLWRWLKQIFSITTHMCILLEIWTRGGKQVGWGKYGLDWPRVGCLWVQAWSISDPFFRWVTPHPMWANLTWSDPHWMWVDPFNLTHPFAKRNEKVS